jgi:hypothetical protein
MVPELLVIAALRPFEGSSDAPALGSSGGFTDDVIVEGNAGFTQISVESEMIQIIFCDGSYNSRCNVF